jgi:hypothetical protein
MMTTGEKLLFVLMVLVTLMLIAIGHPEASGSALGMRLNNGVIAQGNTLIVTCSVPRDARNRWLDAGITDFTNSGRQLEGEASAITNAFAFKPGMCGDNEAYCAVYRTPHSDKPAEIVTQQFKVTGLFCE